MQYHCLRCSLQIEVPPGFAGREIRCPDCGLIGILPQPISESRVGTSDPGAHHVSRPGFERVEEHELDEIYQPIPKRKRQEDAEMDMTPMVDIVFLLLVFFMVTASFGLQKSIELPPPDEEQSIQQGMTPKQPEKHDAEIVVNVTKENRIFVEGEEAPTRQELYALLRDRQHQSGSSTNRLLVVADTEASHEFVVRALDAGSVVGMESVRIQTVE